MEETQYEILPDYNRLIPFVISELVEKSWVEIPGFFSSALIDGLYHELRNHDRKGDLNPAKVGKDEAERLRRDIRGDDILWIDGATKNEIYFLDILTQLRVSLNRELFLGLEELEAHFAIYAPGAGYQKHLDSFQNNNYRRITIVVYLNRHWQPQHAGELLLYNNDGHVIKKVAPVAGTLVCFLSDEIPHEVSVTNEYRYSIAGWFKARESSIL